jgi:KDO2-lipid IV(A) lauroyltransferase
MDKQRSRVADFAVYLVVRLVVCFVQMLSYDASMRLANALAWLMYRVDRRHRMVAADNLKQAFPEIEDEQQIDRLVRATYRHFCRVVMVMIHLPRRFHVHSWKDHLGMIGGKHLVGTLLSGRPILLVTGHFGNWELGGYALGVFGFTTYAIARTLDNPYLDRFLKKFRQGTGQSILAKHGDFDKINDLMSADGIIATLGDQDAGRRGLFVDFFNRHASTHKAIALMSLQYDAPLVVLGIPHTAEPMRHKIIVQDVVLPEDFAGKPDAVRLITERFTQALEALVRQYPEQYFWLHRRWKHQPQAKRAKKAA